MTIVCTIFDGHSRHCYYVDKYITCFLCLAFVLADDDRVKRGLSMLRMGKRDMGYLRMGRAYTIPPLVPPSYILPENIKDRDLMSVSCPLSIVIEVHTISVQCNINPTTKERTHR